MSEQMSSEERLERIELGGVGVWPRGTVELGMMLLKRKRRQPATTTAPQEG